MSLSLYFSHLQIIIIIIVVIIAIMGVLCCVVRGLSGLNQEKKENKL